MTGSLKPIEESGISPELQQELESYARRVSEFRTEGELDPVAIAKLEEHFRASHVYHSAGIEGNRLTLQETVVVLKEGVEISDKPLKDTLEVANLGRAFDLLRTLADRQQAIRETDIRDLHRIVIGQDDKAHPGAYRTTGVVISGSEHRPPEPLAVPGMMQELVMWLNSNARGNPILVGALGHHVLTKIHPFLDGNGRVSRLLMNLVLMRAGIPISNIRREDRPKYYEALAYADVGLPELLVHLIYTRSSELFTEYVRIREETKRMAEWAAQWGEREAKVHLRRESREFELWMSRVRQVFLEFQKASEYLKDELDRVTVDFYDYQSEITLEKYRQFRKQGSTERSNAFAISFNDAGTHTYRRFMFKYFRDWGKYPPGSTAIPLHLCVLQPDSKQYIDIGDSGWREKVRLRDAYFTDEGVFSMRYWNPGAKKEVEERGKTIHEAVQMFFDDVLKNVFDIQ